MVKTKSDNVDKPLVISVRINEKETSEEFIRYIQEIKRDSKKNLSPIALEMMFEGYKSMMASSSEKILLSISNRLNDKQKEWLNYDLSLAFLSDLIGRVIENVTSAHISSNEKKDITTFVTELTKIVSSSNKENNESVHFIKNQKEEDEGCHIEKSVISVESNEENIITTAATVLNGEELNKNIPNEEEDDILDLAAIFNGVYTK